MPRSLSFSSLSCEYRSFARPTISEIFSWSSFSAEARQVFISESFEDFSLETTGSLMTFSITMRFPRGISPPSSVAQRTYNYDHMLFHYFLHALIYKAFLYLPQLAFPSPP